VLELQVRFSLLLGQGVLVPDPFFFFFFLCLGEVLGVRIASHLSFLVLIMRRRWGTCAGVMHESPLYDIYT
jgi:hypothetical protein